MKRIVLVLIFALITTVVLFAQGISFGVKAGINLANQKISGVDYEDPDDVKSLIGFNGGLFLTYMFSEKLGVQPELLYSTEGSTSSWGTEEYTDKLGYLTLPVLFRYNINEMISLNVGPQFGFLLSATEEYLDSSESIKEDFKGSDIAAAFGVEVDLPSKVGFGARYTTGFSDIVKTESSWAGYEIKNSAFQIYVKYRIKGEK